MMHDDFSDKVTESIASLLSYCKRNNWAGFDPFDGLKSPIFERLPFFQNRICRLVFIQSMKRSPVNFRHIFLVPKDQNPKGIALFCSTLIKLHDIRILEDDSLVFYLLDRLIELKSQKYKYYCWGYNFDWQSRTFFLPKFTPNIICTTFAGNAFLDAYDKYKNAEYLDIAISAGNFLLEGLNITQNKDELCFSYTPIDHGQVHNANLLGAAFLSRLYSITHEKKFIEPALKAVRFSIRRQHEDGSWPYGEHKTQKWVDNFHTGYNLVALKRFSEYTGNTDFEDNIRKGFKFYRDNFFTDDGEAKYYHKQKYPIDIHSIAQSMTTLVEFKEFDEGNIDLAKTIFDWSLKHMQSNNGYFFYQQKKFYKNKTPYMRWSQAWMLYALASFAQALRNEGFVSSL